MKFKIIIVTLIASIFIGYPSLYAAESGSKKAASDKTVISDGEIINFIKAFSMAYKKGDIEEYTTFYSPGTMENGANPIDKIKATYLSAITYNVITAYDLDISDIKNLGDSAVIDALYNKTLVDKSKGDALITSGNVRIKLIKEDARLKIATIDYDKYIQNNYVIGTEDLIEVSVWKSPELSISIMVRPDGMISLPLIGDVRADGRTTKELKGEIEQKLAEYKQDPVVSVIVREASSQSIYVTGEVARPGKYPLRSETTIVQAVTLAGGFTQWANKDKIVIIRKSPMNPEGNRFTVRYSDIVSGSNMKANIVLKAGDTVIVP